MITKGKSVIIFQIHQLSKGIMMYPATPDLFATAAYIRLSDEDGDKRESDSVRNQRRLLTEYIEKYDDLILYDYYIER